MAKLVEPTIVVSAFDRTTRGPLGVVDALHPYKRVFSGSPTAWLASYGPYDERIEPEDVVNWRLWYRIELA